MKKIILNILHFLGLPFVFLSFIIGILRLKSKVKKYQQMGESFLVVDRYKIVYKLCKKLLYIKHIKAESKGFENIPKKPVLFIANHKSQIDPIILIKILFEQEGLPYFSMLSKTENQSSKYVKAAMDLIDTIYVDRGNMRQQYEAFEEEIQTINAGRSVIIFAEGTRIYHHEIAEMKPATIKVAQKSYIPIVPIVIYGSSGLMDHNKEFKNKKKIVYVEVLSIMNHHTFVNVKDQFVSELVRQQIADRYTSMHKSIQENKPVFVKDY
ncbi:MAG: 1-acyl-sn-glycerol-3-phosphate acyltransferase [Mycoplasmataceae bacterium]|jgi:1-acyl-sn-glycerol-3-phosphate acyltransferase|nr:1-acyl-sn-glycerol-3-phosphate acyltransferase [Mycoplasmataceae bacterium]